MAVPFGLITAGLALAGLTYAATRSSSSEAGGVDVGAVPVQGDLAKIAAREAERVIGQYPGIRVSRKSRAPILVVRGKGLADPRQLRTVRGVAHRVGATYAVETKVSDPLHDAVTIIFS